MGHRVSEAQKSGWLVSESRMSDEDCGDFLNAEKIHRADGHGLVKPRYPDGGLNSLWRRHRLSQDSAEGRMGLPFTVIIRGGLGNWPIVRDSAIHQREQILAKILPEGSACFEVYRALQGWRCIQGFNDEGIRVFGEVHFDGSCISVVEREFWARKPPGSVGGGKVEAIT